MPDKITKFIRSLNPKLRLKISQRLGELYKDPFQGSDIKKLRGWKDNTYRLRIGTIRIIFRVHKNKVTVTDIDYRGNMY